MLDQNEKDVLGLGLVAAAVFFAFVFYLGWDGGKVGEAFADGFVWLFGGVGYLVPIALFAAGAMLVVGPMLPSLRPFKAGGLMLLAALMLGLAAGTFGLGPDDPPRDAAFETPSWFRHHGGAVGEGLFWIARTLFQEIGAHILFVFLFVAGFMLLTGASIAGVIRATSESVVSTTRRVKRSTIEFARIKPAAGARRAARARGRRAGRPRHARRGAVPIEEEWDDEMPEVVEGQAIDTEDGEEDDEFIVHAPPPDAEGAREELTPAGQRALDGHRGRRQRLHGPARPPPEARQRRRQDAGEGRREGRAAADRGARPLRRRGADRRHASRGRTSRATS